MACICSLRKRLMLWYAYLCHLWIAVPSSIYMYVCTYAYTHVCTNHLYAYIELCMHRFCRHVYEWLYVCVYVYLYACMHICRCMCVPVYVDTQAHTHTHTYMHACIPWPSRPIGTPGVAQRRGSCTARLACAPCRLQSSAGWSPARTCSWSAACLRPVYHVPAPTETSMLICI
jgi:hypothetical protein